MEAAMADIRMIGNIAKEMSRAPSLSVLDRKGPTSLNADKRRKDLRRIDAENERLLKRLESAKPSYQLRDQKKSYQQSRKHVALASVAGQPQLPRMRSGPAGEDESSSPGQQRALKPSKLLPPTRAELPLLPRPRALSQDAEPLSRKLGGAGARLPPRASQSLSPVPGVAASPSASSSSSLYDPQRGLSLGTTPLGRQSASASPKRVACSPLRSPARPGSASSLVRSQPVSPAPGSEGGHRVSTPSTGRPPIAPTRQSPLRSPASAGLSSPAARALVNDGALEPSQANSPVAQVAQPAVVAQQPPAAASPVHSPAGPASRHSPAGPASPSSEERQAASAEVLHEDFAAAQERTEPEESKEEEYEEEAYAEDEEFYDDEDFAEEDDEDDGDASQEEKQSRSSRSPSRSPSQSSRRSESARSRSSSKRSSSSAPSDSAE